MIHLVCRPPPIVASLKSHTNSTLFVHIIYFFFLFIQLISVDLPFSEKNIPNNYLLKLFVNFVFFFSCCQHFLYKYHACECIDIFFPTSVPAKYNKNTGTHRNQYNRSALNRHIPNRQPFDCIRLPFTGINKKKKQTCTYNTHNIRIDRPRSISTGDDE